MSISRDVPVERLQCVTCPKPCVYCYKSQLQARSRNN